MNEPEALALSEYLQLIGIVLALLHVLLFVVDIAMPLKWRYWLTRKLSRPQHQED